jgi:hypothetical protein
MIISALNAFQQANGLFWNVTLLLTGGESTPGKEFDKTGKNQ